MKISELSPEQQEAKRAKWRSAQQKSRSKQKAASVPIADEAFEYFTTKFPTQHQELERYARDAARQVAEELHREFTIDEAYTVDRVARTLFGLKNNLVHRVSDCDGLIVGGMYFLEALGSDLVASVHRYGMEQSSTFSGLYRELLPILDNKFGDTPTKDAYEARCATDIKAEIAGKRWLDKQELEPQMSARSSFRNE
jgi:hypothetical protein